MTDLPSSIEHSLIEAGFTQTELLVLRRLLEEDALTLRELAAKTGKSTGVLDQATKKLLKKRIIAKEIVNDTPKYALKSLDSILQWIKEDNEQKLSVMHSRTKDFESFVSSMKREAKRPEMEHFEGREGIEQAYMKLLDLVPKGGELLHFRPVTCKEEEDPLRVFRVQYFRERRRRGIFSRIVAPDTPLGRRYQSRDAFEYRQTSLVPEDRFPLTFEKIIAGDTVACINLTQESASFLKFPEQAEEERKTFALLQGLKPADAVTPKAPEPIPARTNFISALREFFLSRKSIALFCALALIGAALTYGMYVHTFNLNLQRERERALSIVATGAAQFDADDLDQLHTLEDSAKPVYAKLVRKLIELREANPRVTYSYIMRASKQKEGYLEFVADADSPDPIKEVGPGKIFETDLMTYPGKLFDEFDPYLNTAENAPFSTPDIHSDQWGTYFTTTAPIVNDLNEVAGLLCVDIEIENISMLTKQSFNYLLFFLGFFCLFVFIRLLAFNKPIFKR